MNKPVRLAKQESQNNSYSFFNSIMNKVEAWAYAHATLLLSILLIILMVLFVIVCYAIVGVSATDSGTAYNGMENWI